MPKTTLPAKAVMRLITVLAVLCGAPAAAQTQGIALTPEASLPLADVPIERGFCGHNAIDPVTPGGQAVAEAGWVVTAEEPLGALTAVSFVAGLQPGTSSACVLTGGRIAIFDGAELLALAEGSQPAGDIIGHLRPVGRDRLRIWNGAPLPRPVADIVPEEGGPAIVALPATDTLCDGRVTMPLIHGLSLADAGRLMAENGWEQASHATPSGARAARLAAGGFSNVEHCSPTGFGFCSLVFVHGRATASVLTFG